MSLITLPVTLTNGSVADANDVMSDLNTIANDYNGSITNANISATAAIADSKLATLTTTGKVNISTLAVASQAQGDIIYASSATAWARLGAGTSGQFLKTLGASANPAWASGTTNAKQGATTRDPSVASSTITISGLGFTPKAVLIVYMNAVATNNVFGIGMSDGTNVATIYRPDSGGGFTHPEASAVFPLLVPMKLPRTSHRQ